MNKNHLAIILFSLTATSFVAQAENTPAPATETAPTATVPAEGSADAGSNPCTSIEDACKAAGFMAGGHKSGKGLLKNCMKPILKGKTVTGVTVDPAVVKACVDQHKANKK